MTNIVEKDEKISQAPKELAPLLDLFNFLPAETREFEKTLLDLSNEYNAKYMSEIEVQEKISRLPNDSATMAFQKLDQEYCQKLEVVVPAKLITSGKVNLNDGFLSVMHFLKFLVSEKLILLRIIGSFNVWDGGYKRKIHFSQSFFFEKPIDKFSFNEDSTLKLSRFEIPEILTKNKIPVERIRLCPICHNIFWAKRTESPACSKPCVSTLNKRKSRKRIKINQHEDIIKEERQKLQKQIATLGFEHPSVNKQMSLLDLLENQLVKIKANYRDRGNC